jgi:hypothetical protein
VRSIPTGGTVSDLLVLASWGGDHLASGAAVVASQPHIALPIRRAASSACSGATCAAAARRAGSPGRALWDRGRGPRDDRVQARTTSRGLPGCDECEAVGSAGACPLNGRAMQARSTTPTPVGRESTVTPLIRHGVRGRLMVTSAPRAARSLCWIMTVARIGALWLLRCRMYAVEEFSSWSHLVTSRSSAAGTGSPCRRHYSTTAS